MIYDKGFDYGRKNFLHILIVFSPPKFFSFRAAEQLWLWSSKFQIILFLVYKKGIKKNVPWIHKDVIKNSKNTMDVRTLK